MSRKGKRDKKEKEEIRGQKDSKPEPQTQKTEETDAQAIERQKGEYQALWDRFLRLQAEFDNYKKRSLQDKADFIKFANHGLISELVGILDNFELSIKYADEKNDFKLMHQGVDMIIKQLQTLLKSKGLERIKTIGERFDPHRHDALEIVEDEASDQERVVDEFQPGYLLSGRILRPAKVKVAKPKVAFLAEDSNGKEPQSDESEQFAKEDGTEVKDNQQEAEDIREDKQES